MKKTFKLFALMLLTAFAFSSCVDVPAPFNVPDKSSSSGDGGSASDEGTVVTCAQAAELANALADGATSSEVYTITGYITEVVGDVSRNQQTFWRADTKNGGKVFEAYWANLPDGVTAFTAGTKVKITGKLMKYVNSNTGNVTPERKNAIVTILEDDGGDDSPALDGTEITCAKAAELTNALADGATSAETYSVVGYITEVVGDVSRNQQTFWMADTKDGGKVFEAYWANLPEGVTAFTAGTKVKITGQLMKYVNSNTGNVTPEIKNATVVILPDDGGETPVGDVIDVSCVLAAQMANRLPDNTSSEETYRVTGYITKVIGAVSTKTGTPQQSFWMADKMEDGEVFQAYYANLPEGVSEFTVGMKIEMTGKLYNYVTSTGGAAEMKNGTVVILEDGGGQVNPPSGDIIEVLCSEARDITAALADGGTSAETYAVTGYITEVIGNVSRNQQSFWMADTQDGGQVFEAYWANLPAGVSAFTVGMKVKITGQLMKNVKDGNMTPEIKNADVVILEQGSGGGDEPTPTPGGDPVTELVNGDFELWNNTNATGWKPSAGAGAGNATYNMSQDAHGGSYSCFIKADAAANKRLASEEIKLAAGTYVFSYYAKPATAAAAQTRVGYVPIKDDGSVGAYKYNSAFFNINNNGWTLVENEFTLTEETTICLVIMNPKSNANSQYEAQDILVDDATLTKK